MNGAERIAAERERQVSVEGWTAAHDQCEHADGSMLAAALAYAKVTELLERGQPFGVAALVGSWAFPWKGWWKPSPDRVRNLVKAGALIAAEIDRLQRQERHEAAIVMKPGRGLADS